MEVGVGGRSARALLTEIFAFGLKQARACLFPGIFITILLLSSHVPLLGLARYDFIFLGAVLAQAALVAFGVESRDEVLTLCAFHLLGVVLEVFKTNPAIASWSYPEEGFFEVFDVPLYSGFMYASVASYMCQAWRLLDLDLENYPPYALSVPLSIGIYLNFFTHHFIPDLRWVLAAGVFIVFFKTRVLFTATHRRRSMPLVLAFVLIGFFVWIAENLSTYLGAWTYPGQAGGWEVVSLQKISSWCLLVIVSFVIVADLKHARAGRRGGLRGKTGSWH
ncbi:MAG TPA: DUF817 domain-containing protein [Rubrobacter sp.]|nr:DUF817 domain-containing protein [Rubrobacter sp.]